MTGYSPNIALNEPVPGDPAVYSSWGLLLNANDAMLDNAVAGITTANVAGNSNVILATANGTTNQSLNQRFVLTGVLTAPIQVLWPNGQSRFFSVLNSTTGAYTVDIGANNGSGSAAGTTVRIAQGQSKLLYSDGTNVALQTNSSGYTALVAGSGISVSANTITNTGILSLIAGAGANITNGNTIINTGATGIYAKTGISVTGATGNIGIQNTGVINAIAGAGISVSAATGNVSIVNQGMISAHAGTNITIAGGTTTTGNVAGANITFSSGAINSIYASAGPITVSGTGVARGLSSNAITGVTAGGGISVTSGKTIVNTGVINLASGSGITLTGGSTASGNISGGPITISTGGIAAAVTKVVAGTGLGGGTITGSGTLTNTGALSLHAGNNVTITGGMTTSGNVSGAAITIASGVAAAVTKIVAGSNLTGGTITSSGTIALSANISATSGTITTIKVGTLEATSGTGTISIGASNAIVGLDTPTSFRLSSSSLTFGTLSTLAAGTLELSGTTGPTITITNYGVTTNGGTIAMGAGTLTGSLVALTDYTEKVVNLGNVTGTIGVTLTSGSFFYGTVTGNSTFTLSGAASSGTLSSWSMELTNGGAHTVTWFSGIKWPGGVSPTLSTTGTDVLSFYTRDGGTTVRGVAAEIGSA